jgi:hypothetical protein
MMFLFGLVDILAAFLLVSLSLGVKVPLPPLIIIPLALLLKSFIDLYDIGSITDVVVALLIVVSIFLPLPWWLVLIPALFIFLKGILSFIHL